MATVVSDSMKKVIMDGAEVKLDRAILTTSAGPSGGAIGESSISFSSYSVSSVGLLSNSSDMLFQCNLGRIVYKVHLYNSVDDTISFTIDLDGATGDAFEFTTAGTFTIPSGDLTITVA